MNAIARLWQSLARFAASLDRLSNAADAVSSSVEQKLALPASGKLPAITVEHAGNGKRQTVSR